MFKAMFSSPTGELSFYREAKRWNIVYDEVFSSPTGELSFYLVKD